MLAQSAARNNRRRNLIACGHLACLGPTHESPTVEPQSRRRPWTHIIPADNVEGTFGFGIGDVYLAYVIGTMGCVVIGVSLITRLLGERARH